MSRFSVKEILELKAAGISMEEIAILEGAKPSTTKSEKPNETGMQTTRELRFEDVEKIKKCFKTDQQLFLFLLGLNTALRVSDIIGLTVGKVRQREFIVIEKKTKKKRKIRPSKQLRELIDTYTNGMSNEDFLFASREKAAAKYKSKKKSSTQKNPHITERTARNWIKAAAKAAGIELSTDEGVIGTHTMRKTWAWTMLNTGSMTIDEISLALNHSSVVVTRKYLGYHLEDNAKAFEQNSVGL